MASYAEDVARWRMERKQAQITDRVNQIGAEYAQAVRERDRAIADGDTETAECRDMDCEQLEGEYAQYCPPQQTMHPAAQQWILQNKPFFDRHGAAADNAVRAAHAYVTRQKIPGETNLQRTGMGLRPNTPQYFQALEDNLQMHGPTFFGVKYDPNEKALTATEAAKVSKISANDYNRASQQLAAQGRFSFQEKK